MKRYDWIFFDADNTLFDFDQAEHDALKHVVQDVGLDFNEGVRNTYQKINKECWTAYENGELPKSRLRSIRFERFLETFDRPGDPVALSKKYLAHLAGSTHLIDGASDLLGQLTGKYRLALVTNGLKEVQRPRFRKSGIQHLFEVIVVSDEIGVAKPEAGFFDYTFEQIGKPDPQKVMIVGDNLNSDIRGGVEYGLDTCWYNPNQRPKDHSVTPTYEIDRLGELETILKLS